MKDTTRRQRMVSQLERQGIKNARVLEAMGGIPREDFVDEALRGKAYADAALPIGDKQTISQPWVVARMTELLEPDGSGRVLEIGTGSGYHAAVLAGTFEQVYTVERLLMLSRRARERLRALRIENVHFKVFDGTYGWGEFAPYRGIVVTAAAPEVPEPLLGQLEAGGRLVLPLTSTTRGSDDQVLVRIVKRNGKFVREEHGPCRFVPLLGKYGWKE
ncbi:MAG: protein-L-isoaspartate(D-aspartate) O-methyltransferase [Acidobacteriota bacterium]|nr:protein-L-isoaspartate(D-aspartate) O-methyltransferase [Acidobacteriota bacterium]